MCNKIRYLLRFDDLCPTMRWKSWDEIESLLDNYSIQPILAVVPDNQDPKLCVQEPDPRFWDRAREWQKKGWVIGQHGYQHRYDSTSPGLLRWWNQSELAGHPYETQYMKLSGGAKRLHAEGLKPLAWVAPSHSFDHVTLKVLAELDIRIISDGVSFRPYRDDHGFTWIPAQPWRPTGFDFGYWSLCFHPNTLKTLAGLKRFVETNHERLMGVGFRLDDVIADAQPRRLADVAFETLYWKVFSGRRTVVRTIRTVQKRAKQWR